MAILFYLMPLDANPAEPGSCQGFVATPQLSGLQCHETYALGFSQARINRLAFQGQHAKDALVNAP